MNELINEHIEILTAFVPITLIMLMLAWAIGLFNFRRDKTQKYFVSFSTVLFSFFVFFSVQVFSVYILFILLLLIFSPIVLFTPLSYQTLFQGLEINLTDMTTSSALPFLVCSPLLFLAYYRSMPQKMRYTIWGEPTPVAQKIKSALVAIFAFFVSFPFITVVNQTVTIMILYFVKQTPGEQEVVEHLQRITEMEFFLTACVIVVLVPIAEEILFRGFLQNWFKQKMPVFFAIFFTSLIFAAFHYTAKQGLANIQIFATLFTFACFLGLVKERQKSLVAPIVLHGAFNGFQIILMTL